MDILDLNPEVLESTASIIEGYCNRQKSIMADYLSSTASLSSDWTDDQTLGSMLEEIKQMKNAVEGVMDEILTAYPNYFRSKAEQIRNRPKF
ncbi:MAG: hypothetical protein K2L07_13375 [Lachnospiraceae bacterium]|nr:hypothetical protein [Lachnospiraceae bacterium]